MVILQAGHQHIQQNCDPLLQSGTGAPGEIDWTPSIAAGVRDTLKAAGVEALGVDANFNCDPARSQDYAGVVAIHYQANLPTASGFYVGPGDPNEDGAAAASARLSAAIHAHYAARTGLTFQPGWDNLNIRHYYLFEALSKATPFALIECGVGAPGAPDHDFLHSPDGQATVVAAIAAGILEFLGVLLPSPTPPAPPPPPTPPPLTLEQRVARIEHMLAQASQDLHG